MSETGMLPLSSSYRKLVVEIRDAIAVGVTAAHPPARLTPLAALSL
jgi:hypothetical protein